MMGISENSLQLRMMLEYYKHYMHIEHHAKANGVTYAESKRRFNEKLLEFLKSKRYNVSEDVSSYA